MPLMVANATETTRPTVRLTADYIAGQRLWLCLIAAIQVIALQIYPQSIEVYVQKVGIFPAMKTGIICYK